MARRKSINKRLSRYSKNSMGSAILDPDTENLGDEYPYWWKNLENNTIARPSMESNVGNQTSRHLDPNSHVEPSQATDGWWNALETTDTPNSFKLNPVNARKDSPPSTGWTSESEEEPRIAKRKFPFRSEGRKDKSIGDSAASRDSFGKSVASESARRSKKGGADAERQGQGTEVPKRNYKDRERNAFLDVLDADASASKRSSKIVAMDESRIVAEGTLHAAGKSLVSGRTSTNQLILSFENEDSGRFLVPKAQSTILDGSGYSSRDNKESDNSDIEREVLKPKSRLITRRPGNTERNIFEKILEDQESVSRMDRSEGSKRGANDTRETSSKSFRQSARQGSGRNPAADQDRGRETNASQNSARIAERNLPAKPIPSSDASDVSLEAGPVLKAKSRFLARPNKSRQRNLFEAMLAESSTTDASASRKSESSFSGVDVEVPAVGNSSVSVDKEKERSAIGTEEDGGHSTRSHRKSTADATPSTSTGARRKEEAGKIFDATNKEEGRTGERGRSASRMYSSVSEQGKPVDEVAKAGSGIALDRSGERTAVRAAEIESSKPRNVSDEISERTIVDESGPKRTSTRPEVDETEGTLGGPDRRKRLRYSRLKVASDSDSESESVPPRREIGRASRSGGRSVSRTTERLEVSNEPLGIEPDSNGIENRSKRKTDSFGKSQAHPMEREAGPEEFEVPDTQDTSKGPGERPNGLPRDSRLKVVSDTDSQGEEEEEDTPRRVTRSRSGRAAAVSANESAQRSAPGTEHSESRREPRRSSRGANRKGRESVPAIPEEFEVPDTQDTSKGQIEPPRGSRHEILSDSHSDSDSASGEAVSRRVTRSSAGLGRRSVPATAAMGASSPEVEAARSSPARQAAPMESGGRSSRRSAKSDRRRTVARESGAGDTPKRRGLLRGSRSRILSDSDASAAEEPPPARTGSGSRRTSISSAETEIVSAETRPTVDQENVLELSGASGRPGEDSGRGPQPAETDASGSRDRQRRSPRKSRASAAVHANSFGKYSGTPSESDSRLAEEPRDSGAAGDPDGNRSASMASRLRDSTRRRSDRRPTLRRSARNATDLESLLLEDSPRNSTATPKRSLPAAANRDESAGIVPAGRKLRADLPGRLLDPGEDGAPESKKSSDWKLGLDDSGGPGPPAADRTDSSKRRNDLALPELEMGSDPARRSPAEGSASPPAQKRQKKSLDPGRSVPRSSRASRPATANPVERSTNASTLELEAVRAVANESSVEKEADDRSPESSPDAASGVEARRADALAGTEGEKRTDAAEENDGRETVVENGVEERRERATDGGKQPHASRGSRRMEKAPASREPIPRPSDIPRGQPSIKSFFGVEKALPASQVLADERKAEEIKRELERVKEQEMASLKRTRETNSAAREKGKAAGGRRANPVPRTQRPTKDVPKAFLVNGQVYRVPRLPRPQHWITDRLYGYLWKRMEPRYKMETRLMSEKFVRQLSNVTALILKRKSYVNYKSELYALMKEMARLDVIRTRNDFYDFCHEFFPYELRVRTVPMLLPGNKRNIPYDADKLHEPLLDSSRESPRRE